MLIQAFDVHSYQLNVQLAVKAIVEFYHECSENLKGFLWELLTASDTYELLWSSINETQSLPSLTGVSERELLKWRTSSQDKRVPVKCLGLLEYIGYEDGWGFDSPGVFHDIRLMNTLGEIFTYPFLDL